MKKLLVIIVAFLSLIFEFIFPSNKLEEIPAYTNHPYTIINDNQCEIDKNDYTTKTFIMLKPLDHLGRVQEAFACLGIETMPKEGEKRESIGMIKPSGWHTVRYDDLIEDKYLYNRCHMIAWSLSGLNGEETNLMSGTRSFNVDGMLPFEMEVASYIRRTKHHVLYKATPIFEGNELVARGLQLQAISIEDDEINFNVFIHNVQEGIEIDYRNGKSKRS